MRHLKLTYNLLVALIAIAGFSGCSQDEFVEGQEMQPQEAQLMLSISMPQIGTRAVDGEKTLSGTTEESKCRKFTLFIMDTNGSNIQDKTTPEKIWRMDPILCRKYHLLATKKYRCS